MTVDIATKLRELADEIEQEQKKEEVPDELRDLFGDRVYSVEAEGWDCITDYTVSLNTETFMLDSENVTDFSRLDGYELQYVAWGDQTYAEGSEVELCISEVDE